MSPTKKKTPRRRVADTESNRGQLLWTLFVGAVVALCALMQVSVPSVSRDGLSPVITATPLLDRNPASDMN